jgi:sigma-B regulation protein RsbU (phosphoserine phosphatase)
MGNELALVEKLGKLNQIAQTLNRAVDVPGVLDAALGDLVVLMGLETAWVFLTDRAGHETGCGSGYHLAAHHNLPSALNPVNSDAWEGSCICQGMCNDGTLQDAHNEVRCTRLQSISGDQRQLTVHATVPLRSGDLTLGILNVAAPDWSAFSPESLSLLTAVGGQMGTALERARLYDLLREQRVHEQEALLRLSDQLLHRLDSDELVHYVVDQVRERLGADACALLLPAEVPGMLAFKAASGWQDCPVGQSREVPNSAHSAPGLVMRTQQALQTEDLQEDDANDSAPPWLLAEGFRGHAVVPLVVEGRSVGILVLNQRTPRLLDAGELQFLQLMANQAALTIEKARLHVQEVEKKAIESELAVGRKIQLGLLPERLPDLPGWEVAAYYQAAREVGGDFYDVFELPSEPQGWGFVIGDVSGKGVPAALFMARSATMIYSSARDGRGPAGTLQQVNDLLLRQNRFDLFLTAVYARLYPESGRLVFANGGHTRPIWCRAAAGDCVSVATRGILLGAFGSVQLQERALDLAPGDTLVLYTDGVSEAMDPNGNELGEAALLESVRKAATIGGSAEQILQAIVARALEHTGAASQFDDVALLVLRRRPA